MKKLNTKTLNQFIEKASLTLKGQWVLLGGSLLPALGIDYRSTTDIDFSPVHSSNNKSVLEMMSIAEELDLPIETINASAEYFLKKIKDFDKRLILMKKGPNSEILRPSLSLYLELKLNRSSESDLADCKELISYIIKNGFIDEIEDAKIYLSKRKNKSEVMISLLKQIEKI